MQTNGRASFSTVTLFLSPALDDTSCIVSQSSSEPKLSIHSYLLDNRPSPDSLLNSSRSLDFEAPPYALYNTKTEIHPFSPTSSSCSSFQCKSLIIWHTCDEIHISFKSSKLIFIPIHLVNQRNHHISEIIQQYGNFLLSHKL